LQETFVEASDRLGDYRDQQSFPPYLWLRYLALQRVLILHRRQLAAQVRDARLEVPLVAESMPEVSSIVFAAQLMDSGTSPSMAAARAETRQRLEQALQQLEPMDREVLALRHFEQLNNAETAAVLGIELAASSQRYYRALKRLKELLATLPGGWSFG
jgi:RNA polymerase sigma-70 factor (ECF subfamily)